jgi:hypothetical protein
MTLPLMVKCTVGKTLRAEVTTLTATTSAMVRIRATNGGGTQLFCGGACVLRFGRFYLWRWIRSAVCVFASTALLYTRWVFTHYFKGQSGAALLSGQEIEAARGTVMQRG